MPFFFVLVDFFLVVLYKLMLYISFIFHLPVHFSGYILRYEGAYVCLFCVQYFLEDFKCI